MVIRQKLKDEGAMDFSLFKIAQFSAGSVRKSGANCLHNPHPDNFSPALVLMPDGNAGKVLAKKLSDLAVWVEAEK